MVSFSYITVAKDLALYVRFLRDIVQDLLLLFCCVISAGDRVSPALQKLRSSIQELVLLCCSVILRFRWDPSSFLLVVLAEYREEQDSFAILTLLNGQLLLCAEGKMEPPNVARKNSQVGSLREYPCSYYEKPLRRSQD